MKGKIIRSVFWALVAVFVIVVVLFVVPLFREFVGFIVIAVLGGAFFLLGVALIVMTVKARVQGRLKKFLLLTGASSAGVLVSVILHNLVYAAFIYFLGDDFWDRTGLGDEPVFFILGLIVCPIAFLVGIIGSAVLNGREKTA